MLMAMLAEYQHWFDGILVNGTESFEGAVEGGFSLYTREIAGSIRPHHFPDLASLLIGKVHTGQSKSGEVNCLLWLTNGCCYAGLTATIFQATRVS